MIKIKALISLGLIGSYGALTACGGQAAKPQTLGDIDTPIRGRVQKTELKTEKSQEEIKKAYYDYIAGAAKDDRFRVQAATRIAELQLSIENDKQGIEQTEQFEASIRNTIKLLEDALRDFPDAVDNDHSMYQLAKAYDQIAETDKAIGILEKLVTQYPSSPYYIESKFRIAENAFINGLYFKAEDAYTDVLRNSDNEVFFEKALFKRGWARYKQELYADALDDFYDAIYRHNFAPKYKLDRAEAELFDEYFRGVGLAFSYIGGTDAIYAYHSERRDPIYVYYTYYTVAQMFLKQERYTDAADAFKGYVIHYPKKEHAVEASIAMTNIWKQAGFFNRYVASFEDFYKRYGSHSKYWQQSGIERKELQDKLATENIRENIVLLASHFHNQYLKSSKPANFTAAQAWYERYLKDYQAYARQDKINQLYAELLKRNGNDQRALTYYELAAFDGDIVLDKDSAYASLFLTNKLYQKAAPEQRPELLDKYLNYANLYAQLYSNEKRTSQVVQNAVQLSAKAGLRDRVIELASALPNGAPKNIENEVRLLKAQAYFDLKNYEEAELIYQDLLANPELTGKNLTDLTNKLAVTLYKQGESFKQNNQGDLASKYFLRIYHELPNSELAPTATYDAIALFMQNQQWDKAINYLNAFKESYPNNPYQSDVAKKLSVAYLKSNRGLDAAREFEKLSDYVSNEEEKMAAQWQAAQLYYEKDQLESALRAFKEYAHTYKRPFAQNMEAMNYLTEIYQKLGERNKKIFWLNKIVQADNKAASNLKSDRTQYLAAQAAFNLAYLRRDEFASIRLRIPLAKSLKLKKKAMQDSVKLYGKAATYGHAEFVTQSTMAIAEIYQDFAKALMESERPKNLNDEELEQYNILIEDQVFPFEDKAIEFYETNVKRIAGGVYDQSVAESIKRLKTLFPARYARAPKVEPFVTSLVK